MTRCSVSRPTATSWLGAFAEAGLLQDIKVGRSRLFVNREFLQLLVRAEPSTNGLRTDGREGRHLHVSIPADAGGDPRHVKKLDRSPKHAKILQSFSHVSSQAIVDRGDLSGDVRNT